MGTLLPLSGSLGSKGPSRQKAADLAARHINQAGGVQGQSLALMHEDSATDAETAVQNADKLLKENPDLPIIIGASSSAVSEAVLQSLHGSAPLLISPSSTSARFTEMDAEDRFFRTAPSDAFQGKILAERIFSAGIQTLSVLHLDDAYGNSLLSTLSQAFEALGGQIIAAEAYAGGDLKNAQTALKKLLNAEGNAICLIGYPEEAPALFNTWLDSSQKSELRWFFSDGLKAAQIVDGVKMPTRLDGSLGTVPSSSPRDESKLFESAYLEAYQELPVSFAANTYDAVVLAALALHKLKTGHAENLQTALREVSAPPGRTVGPGKDSLKEALELIAQGQDVDYEGASGKVNLDAQGDVISDYEIWTLKRGFIFRVETISPGL